MCHNIYRLWLIAYQMRDLYLVWLIKIEFIATYFLQNIIQDRDNVGDLLKTETYSSYITSLLRQVYVMEIIIQFL